MLKTIMTSLNGKRVAIELSEVNGVSEAKILPAYSFYCYETNACCACKDDKTGKTCLNNKDNDILQELDDILNFENNLAQEEKALKKGC